MNREKEKKKRDEKARNKRLHPWRHEGGHGPVTSHKDHPALGNYAGRVLKR